MNRALFIVVTIFPIVSLIIFFTVLQERNGDRANLKLKHIDEEALKWLAVYMPPSFAVLVHSCRNPTVSSLVEQLLAYRSSKDELVVIVIQHCWHKETMRRLKSFGNRIYLIQGPEIILPHEYVETAYNHFWAFNLTFHNLRFESAVVMNDSLKISPDFQSYFEFTMELLRNDLSVWCVSGYNGNGEKYFVDSTKPYTLYRTEFFSGVAWMILKEKWREFGTKEWPKVYFQDWIRQQTVARTLACIRPELSRVKFISDNNGLSASYKEMEAHQDIFLYNFIEDPPKPNLVEFEKQNYDRELIRKILESIDSLDYLTENQFTPVKMIYENEEDFTDIAKELGIKSNLEHGVPMNSYKGIVTTMFQSRRIYIIPSYIGKIQTELFGYK
ncbi:hypothetical protein LSTR_LSTR010196 [Laodelphax striatellus]|uniref:Alpha-1,3-mannosyl-glycoprotein 2-beta-N-acetylglucosaminyltransferase n=1 Tax=Laodelphax striatellus TaxID=195883 RepID=A0A482WPG7_LAOST|nr:hypothetical protein LSTR_LSTR010196 [Laodelphax striatellus]